MLEKKNENLKGISLAIILFTGDAVRIQVVFYKYARLTRLFPTSHR